MKANKDDVPKNILVTFSFLVCFSLVVVVHSQDIGQAGMTFFFALIQNLY